MAHIIATKLIPGDIIFDIGANIGNKTEWFSSQGLTVVSVEPQPAMIAQLQNRFANTPNVTIVDKGIGSAKGMLKMSISTQAPTLSTFTEHWKHGRFSDIRWDSAVDVEIITLDDLVHLHGVPRYCKIDVEGFELEVIKGLSTKIGIISFEFTSEFIGHAFEIIGRLISLGYKKFNISLGEDDTFQFDNWLPYHELVAILQASRTTANLWGDIYAN
jgi:FkbM family methyltransferase